MNTKPTDPNKPQAPQELEDAPEGDLPGLDEHNRRMLRDRSSTVVDSILPVSPTDDQLRGNR